jgi:hypothetical protein
MQTLAWAASGLSFSMALFYGDGKSSVAFISTNIGEEDDMQYIGVHSQKSFSRHIQYMSRIRLSTVMRNRFLYSDPAVLWSANNFQHLISGGSANEYRAGNVFVYSYWYLRITIFAKTEPWVSTSFGEGIDRKKESLNQ